MPEMNRDPCGVPQHMSTAYTFHTGSNVNRKIVKHPIRPAVFTKITHTGNLDCFTASDKFLHRGCLSQYKQMFTLLL